MNQLLELKGMLDWAQQLNGTGEETFFQPIQEGKWSPAEILAHMTAWDQYTLENRFERIGEGKVNFDSFPEFDSFNAEAAAHARNTADKSQLIREFIETRERVIQFYENLPEEKRKQPFWIGSHQLTIDSYIKDFSEHDRHHRQQIDKAAGLEEIK
ncbi:DinB family protein [Metabacillus sp. KIGAM252]|uniref:DinB family protein n=1 Tax=Metabacillus flavus TaxID=2823519 RepID=A0ABS5LD15_9BACI|nr:DinB family protein [Metabacillus flavus]MBS2968638.1 DinB family protein [Metabacillus flavus]